MVEVRLGGISEGFGEYDGEIEASLSVERGNGLLSGYDCAWLVKKTISGLNTKFRRRCS